MAFFLDDGVLAGKPPAVQLFLSTLELLLHDIGLTIARDKTELAPACSPVQNFTPGDFAGSTWVADGNVKLLGAAIGHSGLVRVTAGQARGQSSHPARCYRPI